LQYQTYSDSSDSQLIDIQVTEAPSKRLSHCRGLKSIGQKGHRYFDNPKNPMIRCTTYSSNADDCKVL